jgi:Pyridine nucleotide-disulphide oxidoreductase
MTTDPKRIVILGGGFAGVYTARYLEKLLCPEQASITLINRENYWVYQPMLPEVIPGSIGLTNVVSPIRRLCPRTNLPGRKISPKIATDAVAELTSPFCTHELSSQLIIDQALAKFNSSPRRSALLITSSWRPLTNIGPCRSSALTSCLLMPVTRG